MSVQNLRNKYYDHPRFKPLIEHCDKNNISFEVMKETRLLPNYKIEKVYYLKIEDVLIANYVDSNSWNSIALILAKAYVYLGLEIPEALKYLIESFEGKNNV